MTLEDLDKKYTFTAFDFITQKYQGAHKTFEGMITAISSLLAERKVKYLYLYHDYQCIATIEEETYCEYCGIVELSNDSILCDTCANIVCEYLFNAQNDQDYCEALEDLYQDMKVGEGLY
jgi:hypothetical protein